MKRFALLLALLPATLFAQSVPNGGTITQGQVWTPLQWTTAWGAKVDVNNGVLYTPILNGPTLDNPIISAPTITGQTTSSLINATNAFTYGWGNTAVGLSVVANSTHMAQVMGTFGTVGVIGSYGERDSVGLYFDNTAPALLASSTGVFSGSNPGTFTPATPLSALISAKLQQQMIIDTNDATKYSGLITAWTLNGSGQATSITVDAWVQTGQAACGTNPGLGSGCVAGTPSGTVAYINPVTKVFAGNSVATIPGGSYPEGIAASIHEFDMNDLSSSADTNTTWGVDVSHLNTGTHAATAYIARGWWHYGMTCEVTGTACFYVPAGTNVSAGFLYSDNAGSGFQTNGNPSDSFESLGQTTGVFLHASGLMTSAGAYITMPFLAQNYLGQVDIGSLTTPGASPLVLHDSGHAGGDLSITVSGGTGASDGIGGIGDLATRTSTALAIASLPACPGGVVTGASAVVSNGVASPTYFGAVSTTGSTVAPVFCSNSGWVYH